MISDILNYAVFEITRYQRNEPEAYESLRPEIDRCVQTMQSLYHLLNEPPSAEDQND